MSKHSTTYFYPYQVFLCHASVDKAIVVLPFSEILTKADIKYWIDQEQANWGDLIMESVTKGLEQAEYVIVFLSQHFLASNWACAELYTELSLQIQNNTRRILPIILNEKEACLKKFRMLNSYRYLSLEQEDLPSFFQRVLYELKVVLDIKSGSQEKVLSIQRLNWYKQQLEEGNVNSLKMMFQQSLQKDSMLYLIYCVACLKDLDLTSTDASPSMIQKLETHLLSPLENTDTRSTALLIQAFIKYDFYKNRHWDTEHSIEKVLKDLLDLKRPPDDDLIKHLNFSRNFQLKIRRLMAWIKRV